MVKTEKKSTGKKIAYILAAVGVAGALVFGGLLGGANKDKKALGQDVSALAVSVADLQAQADAGVLKQEEADLQIAELSGDVVNLNALLDADEVIIEKLKNEKMDYQYQ